MLETGVLSSVDQPTDWCAPMVVMSKNNGKVRVCVHLSKLNEFVKRENHPLPAVDMTLGRLAGFTVFTKLDANSGFLADQTGLGIKSFHHIHHTVGTVLFQCVAAWNQLRFREIPEDHETNPVGLGGCGVQHR